MKIRRALALIVLLTSGPGSPGWGAFFSRGSVAIGASATVSALPQLQVTPLPDQAFFGKNVVIPVQLSNKTGGPISTSNLIVSMMYQLVDPYGAVLSPSVTVPVSFASSSAVSKAAGSSALSGSAIIQVADLEPIRHGGGLQYIFQIQLGGSRTLVNKAGTQQVTGAFSGLPSPFQTTVITSICQQVGPDGARLSAPDFFENDGQTAVILGPNAVSGQGTLCLKQEDPALWPAGPGGSQPAAIYTVTLDGAALNQTATLTLSYPADPNGDVAGLHVSANDLSIFSLEPENAPASAQSWQLLSRVTVDPTLHTVTGFSSHFSTFALFAAAGDNSASALRPKERIITPNGDGMNDTATFTGLTSQEEVRIFDARGRRVRTIHGPPHIWDGKDDSGRVVESGVYIYQYTSQGERVSGVIAVAK